MSVYSKKATISLIFSIISMIPVLFLVSGFFLPYNIANKLSVSAPILGGTIFFITLPTSIVGLIFGKKDLKSANNKLAITGIILSLVSLSVVAILFLWLLEIARYSQQ